MADTVGGMLHFQKLDVMRADEVIGAELYSRGIELLERIVAVLTKAGASQDL